MATMMRTALSVFQLPSSGILPTRNIFCISSRGCVCISARAYSLNLLEMDGAHTSPNVVVAVSSNVVETVEGAVLPVPVAPR